MKCEIKERIKELELLEGYIKLLESKKEGNCKSISIGLEFDDGSLLFLGRGTTEVIIKDCVDAIFENLLRLYELKKSEFEEL